MTEDFNFLMDYFHGGTPPCPHCFTDRPYWVSTRECYKCRACGRQYSALSGTPFARRKTPIRNLANFVRAWVKAGEQMTAAEAQRTLEFSDYKSGWATVQAMRAWQGSKGFPKPAPQNSGAME